MSTSFFNYDDFAEEPITAPVPVVRAPKPVTVPIEAGRDTDEVVRAVAGAVGNATVDTFAGVGIAVKAVSNFAIDADGMRDVLDLWEAQRELRKDRRAARKARKPETARRLHEEWKETREQRINAMRSHRGTTPTSGRRWLRRPSSLVLQPGNSHSTRCLSIWH